MSCAIGQKEAIWLNLRRSLDIRVGYYSTMLVGIGEHGLTKRQKVTVGQKQRQNTARTLRASNWRSQLLMSLSMVLYVTGKPVIPMTIDRKLIKQI
ncbi:hypothetical protein TNCV_3042061 [Trichonephila clavipes]|nr:hypothetical protein TNCV_3042061 [Trichonephila clavipes]